MPKVETTANALNGQEIKDIIKMKMSKIIEDIPLLRVGTTFKQAEIEFAFSMKAYPSDVPVPDDFEIGFEIPSLNEEDRKSIEVIKKHVNKLIDTRDEFDEKIEDEINKYVKIIESGDNLETASAPDKTRIENNLPIPVIQETGTGQRVEVPKDINELKSGGQLK